jgi:hypothetical protein
VLQIVLSAIVIGKLMLSPWPAMIVAFDHRGLRTAVVAQDFPVVTRAQRGYRGSGFVP